MKADQVDHTSLERHQYIRGILITLSLAAFSIGVFMSGIVAYGEYQKQHLLKYIPQATFSELTPRLSDDE